MMDEPKSIAESDAILRDWRRRHDDPGADVCNDLHVHFILFESQESGHWSDIADEATRIYALMFNQDAQAGSPIHALYAATAASASSGAFAAVARCLGLDHSALESAVATWHEGLDGWPAPITCDELRRRVDAYRQWHNDLDTGRMVPPPHFEGE